MPGQVKASVTELRKIIESLQTEINILKASIEALTEDQKDIISKQFKKYTNSNALSAMGIKNDGNALHHDRYTDTEVKEVAVTTQTRAYLGTDHNNIPTAVWTTIHIDTIDFDPDNNFSTGNYWYTVPETGYYMVMYYIKWGQGIPADTMVGSGICEDAVWMGSAMGELNLSPGYCSVGGVDVFYLTSGRHITLKGYQKSGVNQMIRYYNKASTYIVIKKIL